jgi:hypothetical protein
MERTNQMITFLIIYFSLGVIAAIFTYGITIGYFWHEFPSLQNEKGRFDELVFRGIAGSLVTLLIPFCLIVTFFELNSAKHGLLFREPKL